MFLTSYLSRINFSPCSYKIWCMEQVGVARDQPNPNIRVTALALIPLISNIRMVHDCSILCPALQFMHRSILETFENYLIFSKSDKDAITHDSAYFMGSSCMLVNSPAPYRTSFISSHALTGDS